MKNCVRCKSLINDNNRFCPVCGIPQPIPRTVYSKYCTNCGCQLTQGEKICRKCGRPVDKPPVQQTIKKATPVLIKTLSNRIQLCTILWVIIGSFQLLLGLILFYVAVLSSSWDSQSIISMLIYFGIGSLNIYTTINLFKYKNKIISDFVGIVRANKINTATVINYFYNAFVIFIALIARSPIGLFLAIVTLAAIILDLTLVKLFVTKNRESFSKLESAQMSSHIQKNIQEEPIPQVDLNSKYFKIYADFTVNQLEDIMKHADQYNKEAFYVAKMMYEAKIKEMEKDII
jgi:RNA polymerase subunit RPABC4/transcription elongation factor Spt4